MAPLLPNLTVETAACQEFPFVGDDKNLPVLMILDFVILYETLCLCCSGTTKSILTFRGPLK